MTINLTDYIREVERADDAEEKLALVTEKFRVFSETARCYLCEEKIGTERWRIGGYTSGNKEVVHQSCWDEEAERASSQESYWCGIEPKEVSETFYGKAPDGNGSRGGQPEGKAETPPRACVSAGAPSETPAKAEGISTDARGHGDDRHQRDVEESWSPTHVAGLGGPVEVRLPERIIPLDQTPITKRVLGTSKVMLREDVKGEFINYHPKMVFVDKIARGLKDKGVK